MKRTPLTRRTPLKAKKACPKCSRSLCSCGKDTLRSRNRLARKSRIRPVNPGRRVKRFREGFESEERVAWYRHQFCVVPGCEEGPCEVAHVRSRGAGGTADDAVPMCHSHHSESHQIGILTFQKKHGLDLGAEAHRFARAWQRWEAREE